MNKGLLFSSVLCASVCTLNADAGSVFRVDAPFGALSAGVFTTTVDDIDLTVTAFGQGIGTTGLFNVGGLVTQKSNGLGAEILDDTKPGQVDGAGGITEILKFSFAPDLSIYAPGVKLESITFKKVDGNDEFTATADGIGSTGVINIQSAASSGTTVTITDLLFGSMFEVATVNNNDNWRIKKIEISTTAATSIPVPTPATFAVGLPAMMLVAARRRRRSI